jgi:hypothetical protein
MPARGGEPFCAGGTCDYGLFNQEGTPMREPIPFMTGYSLKNLTGSDAHKSLAVCIDPVEWNGYQICKHYKLWQNGKQVMLRCSERSDALGYSVMIDGKRKFFNVNEIRRIREEMRSDTPPVYYTKYDWPLPARAKGEIVWVKGIEDDLKYIRYMYNTRGVGVRVNKKGEFHKVTITGEYNGVRLRESVKW